MGVELVLEGLRKRFPGQSVDALAIDLHVPRGARLAVIGPSGAGKTTLLRIVAGLETPTSGDVRFDGASVAQTPPWRRNVSMLGQDAVLLPHRRVSANVALGVNQRVLPLNQELLELLDLGPLWSRWPDQLSGGQRQRVALAQAVSRTPDVLLLDEPFARLEPATRRELRLALQELIARTGSTALLVTHDWAEALAFGELIAVLDAGRVLQVGSAGEIYHRPVHREVARLVGDPPMNVLELDALRAAVSDERGHPQGGGSMWDGWESRAAALGVRPERVVFQTDNPSTALWRWPGRVDHLEPRGDAFLARVRVGNQRVWLQAASAAAARVGAGCVLGIDRRDLVWFDATGRRIDDETSPTNASC